MQVEIFFQILLGLSCLTSGYLGQTSCYTSFEKISGCKGKGMISGVDSFTVSAHLDNSSGSVPELAQFRVRENGETSFTPECIVRLSQCSNIKNKHCDCWRNDPNITAYFNRTATVVPLDRAEIRLHFSPTEGCSEIVETVEDASNAICAPTTVKSNAYSSDCQFEFQNSVKYCCNDTVLSPIETTITFENMNHTTNGSRCASVDASVVGNGTYTITRKVCGIQVYSSSCYGTPGKAGGGGGGDGCDWLCILLIILGILLAICLLLVWFLIWKYYPDERFICCCKKTSICCCDMESVCCFKKTPAQCCMTTSKTEQKDSGQQNGQEAGTTVTIIISVDASREVLEKKVKDELSEDKKRTLTKPLSFKYKGTTMGPEENWRLKELLPECRGDLVLIVIVHLDESHLCEIKEVKEKASSGRLNSVGNNQVTQM